MTIERRADLVLAAVLDDLAGGTDLAYVDDVLRATARTRQSRFGASVQRWLPMPDTTGASAAGPRVTWRGVALAMALVALLAAGLALLAGSARLHQLAPPFGLARTGLVAFEQNGDIVATLPDGSGLRPLVTGPGIQWGPIWSHRGDRFAYWSSTDLMVDPASLWVADSDGSNQRPLTSDSVQGVDDFFPTVSWSPDDQQLAFTNAGDLDRVNADGTGLRTIAAGGGRRRIGPVWSPDGSLIAYTSQPLGDPAHDQSVWVIAPDGRGDQEVIPSEGSQEIGSNLNPSWSPDSRSLITHTGGAADPNPISIARRNPVGAWSPSQHLVSSPEQNFLPAWSTTGTQFTFLREIIGTPDFSLMAADADGSNVRQLSPRHLSLTTPCWSPDDRFIRVEAAAPDRNADRTFLLIPLDGSPPVEIHALDGVTAGCNPQRLAP
jgi:Tol biopolymer transport system component